MSGAEPLRQARFVERVFAECGELGIRTALDTSGLLGGNASDRLLDATDLVLLDLKAGSKQLSRRATGAPLQPTLDFGDRLSTRGTPVRVQFTIIPRLTDSVQNVEDVASIVAAWGTVERVDLLPLERTGENRWVRLSPHYRPRRVPVPTATLVQRIRSQFREHGIPAG